MLITALFEFRVLIYFVYDFILNLYWYLSLCVSFYLLGVLFLFVLGVLAIIENNYFSQSLSSGVIAHFIALFICSRL